MNDILKGIKTNISLSVEIFKNFKLHTSVFFIVLFSIIYKNFFYIDNALSIGIDYIISFLPILLLSILLGCNNENNSFLNHVKNFFKPLIKIRIYILFIILSIFVLLGFSQLLKIMPEFLNLIKYAFTVFQEEINKNPELLHEEKSIEIFIDNLFNANEVFKNHLHDLKEMSNYKLYVFFTGVLFLLLFNFLIASFSVPIILYTDMGVFKSIYVSFKHNIINFKFLFGFIIPHLIISIVFLIFIFSFEMYILNSLFKMYLTLLFIYYMYYMFIKTFINKEKPH